MAKVKTFRIFPNDIFGVPDRDIASFLEACEKEEIISVQTCYLPAMGPIDPRIVVIVTKLDDLPIRPLDPQELAVKE